MIENTIGVVLFQSAGGAGGFGLILLLPLLFIFARSIFSSAKPSAGRK